MNTDFLQNILEISTKYKFQTQTEFNIFSVLHSKYDERRLHSRFISNLLSPNSSHGQNDFFLKKFIDHIGISEFNLNEIEVTPNEFNKQEWNNIDIYIRNKHQAIIIENKIFARDSNQFDENSGIIIPQLFNYYKKVIDDLKIDDTAGKRNIHLVYLTLKEKEPSYIDYFREKNITPIQIDYIRFIPSWLEDCQKSINNPSLIDSIEQYRNLLFEITNNFKLTIKLKSLVSQNIDNVWDLLHTNQNESEILKHIFIHIKWHTVHEFWNELGEHLQNKLRLKVNFPSDDLITKTTHRNFKKGLALNFTYNDKHIYISNDRKGFTWGIQSEWGYFKFDNSQNIIFSDFMSKETFQMINNEFRKYVIEMITIEIINIINTK